MLDRNARNHQAAFTIVELLIVIVVIAILAAVVIVGYSGIRTSALESSIANDLKTGAKLLELHRAQSSTYPESLGEIAESLQPPASNGAVITYEEKPYGYCLSASHSSLATDFVIRSTNGAIEEGDCSITVSTLAGSGTQGGDDGAALSATFNAPRGIAMHPNGALYVADYNGHRIRSIANDSTVTTLVGDGTSGNVNGSGANVRLRNPRDLVVAESGDIFLLEYHHSALRRVTTQGEASTSSIAYTGYSYPGGVGIDALGNFYVSSLNYHNIYKISPAGDFSVLAGNGAAGDTDGTGAAASFRGPEGVAVDEAGNVYVAESGNDKIRKITPTGTVSTVAGSGTAGNADGIGTAAQFNNPKGIAVDVLGNLYVTQTTSIRKITPDGTVTTIAGGTSAGYADGVSTSARFSGVYGITLSNDSTALYVADSNNHRIRKISL